MEFRVMVAQCGFATVNAANEEEALKKAQNLCEDDFDWERFSDCVESAEIVEELPIDEFDDSSSDTSYGDNIEELPQEYFAKLFDDLAEASYTDYISQMAHLSHASHCETDNEPIMSDDSDITEDDSVTEDFIIPNTDYMDDPVMEDDPHYDDSVIDDDYLRWASEHYWEEEAEFAAGTHPTQICERIEQRLRVCAVNYETLELRNWADTSVDIVLDGKFFGHFDYKNDVLYDE